MTRPRYYCDGCRRPLGVAGKCRACADLYVWLNDPWLRVQPEAADRARRTWERRKILEEVPYMALIGGLAAGAIWLLTALSESLR